MASVADLLASRALGGRITRRVGVLIVAASLVLAWMAYGLVRAEMAVAHSYAGPVRGCATDDWSRTWRPVTTLRCGASAQPMARAAHSYEGPVQGVCGTSGWSRTCTRYQTNGHHHPRHPDGHHYLHRWDWTCRYRYDGVRRQWELQYCTDRVMTEHYHVPW